MKNEDPGVADELNIVLDGLIERAMGYYPDVTEPCDSLVSGLTLILDRAVSTAGLRLQALGLDSGDIIANCAAVSASVTGAWLHRLDGRARMTALEQVRAELLRAMSEGISPP